MSAQSMKGVVIGLVSDLEDPEELGRIRVTYPWMSDSDNTSNWARVAAPLAGPELGMFFQPEVGDEALLAFEMDDVRRPYILGYLWNGDNAPPQEDPLLRTIKTVSGHSLIFDDTEGSEAVTVEDASGNKMTMNADGVAIEDANDNTITMNADGVAIEDANGNTMTMNSDGITMESSGDITIKGSNINIEASAQLTGKGNPVHFNP